MNKVALSYYEYSCGHRTLDIALKPIILMNELDFFNNPHKYDGSRCMGCESTPCGSFIKTNEYETELSEASNSIKGFWLKIPSRVFVKASTPMNLQLHILNEAVLQPMKNVMYKAGYSESAVNDFIFGLRTQLGY